MEKLNVAIADDNERMLELLDEIISQDQELEIVGKAVNGEEAYQIIKTKHPEWCFWILSCRSWTA